MALGWAASQFDAPAARVVVLAARGYVLLGSDANGR